MFSVVAVVRVGFATLAAFSLAIALASLAGADYGPRTTIGDSYQQWSDVQSQNGFDPRIWGLTPR